MTPGSESGDAADRETPAILSIGAAAIDEWYAVSNLPEPDGGAFASEVTSAFGGVGANVAVALARLGRRTGLVSRVGDDEYGRRAREYLADTDVDATHVAVGDDPHTRSLILRDPDGERAIVTAGESFRGLRLGDDALAAMADADAVFLTAYAPDRVSRRVLDRVAALREDDETAEPPALVFDLSGSVAELIDRGTEPETIHRFLHAADLFVADGVAAPAFFGSPSAAVERIAAAQIGAAGSASRSRRGPQRDSTWPRAVLTHGADGMTAIAGGDVSRFDAFDVDTVDATGAGDAFTAGLIDRWIAGASPRTPEGGDAVASENGDAVAPGDGDAVAAGARFAGAVAAINCTARFTQPGLPTRSEVGSFLAERGYAPDGSR